MISLLIFFHDHNSCLQSLEEQLKQLTEDFEKATAEKMKCQQEADATNATIQLANRLIGGLASENVRWAEAVARCVSSLLIYYRKLKNCKLSKRGN